MQKHISDTLHRQKALEEAIERGKAFNEAFAERMQKARTSIQHSMGEADVFRNGEEREVGNASVVSCNRITAI